MGKIPVYRVTTGSRVQNIRASGLSSSISLRSADQFAYLVRLDIGGQDFMVLLDTGSSDLWVVSSDCTGEDCQGIPKYQRTASLNLTNVPFHLDYLVGAVSGLVGSETVTLGTYEITSQTLAVANSTSGLGLSGTGDSGILGLAFPPVASIPDTSGRTLVENILSPFSEDSDRFFSFHLARDQNGSSFTVGELDPAFANSTDALALSPVFSSSGDGSYDYWKMPLRSLTLNGTAFYLSASRTPHADAPIAVLDTGTTLILGPTADVDRFWESVGGAQKTEDGWKVPCSRAVSLGLVLGDSASAKEYAVDPADVSWPHVATDDGWCLGGVQGNDGVFAADWLLGDTFLRNVYVTHHAATRNQPPMIGLLGVTDAASALAAFTSDRGPDATPPGQIRARPAPSDGLSAGDICGLAAAGGFVAGAAMLALVYTCMGCRTRR